MASIHNLGFPRIGKKRELKFALEGYWNGSHDRQTLQETAARLRREHWQLQSQLDWVPVGDFSLYDQVLDTSFMLGHIPQRVQNLPGDELDQYFRVARGRSVADRDNQAPVRAGEMTKWFDTNYHYIVPEFEAQTCFVPRPQGLLQQLDQALEQGISAKPVLLGPITYLWLGKMAGDGDKLELLPHLLATYGEVLHQLAQTGVTWVQIDEPVLVMELPLAWQQALETAYEQLAAIPLNLLLATYFGSLGDNLELACRLRVSGLHVDAVRGAEQVPVLMQRLGQEQVLSLGVVDGRNVWKSDLHALLDWLEPLQAQLGQRLWLAPSCSLLHVPVDLQSEEQLDSELYNWLAFAVQKLEELQTLGLALNQGREAVASELALNQKAVASRRQSARLHDPQVQQRLAAVDAAMAKRQSPYAQRAKAQQQQLNLPWFPTTTIGSFPQTPQIRQQRNAYRSGKMTQQAYHQAMQEEVARCVQEQEQLGLDVLVHGEPERNDMVEYFGEQLKGFAFTQFGWVQSFGSRCVKPPILYGDVSRPGPMTVAWISFAQSLTEKPMKGMLTGPVTLLNWSFVREDQPYADTCLQLALALRDEVQDLEQAGINVIQMDEAALREGLPLRRSQWQAYLDWAIRAFRIAANGVADTTQIHTHMCYSEFNDIIEDIAAMDADVITIESSRSNMELLDVFDRFQYPNAIGPGVYDIHSPNIPSAEHMEQLLQQALRRIPAQQLWVNPDCGLKTRQWQEVLPALQHMVTAARRLRQQYTPKA